MLQSEVDDVYLSVCLGCPCVRRLWLRVNSQKSCDRLIFLTSIKPQMAADFDNIQSQKIHLDNKRRDFKLKSIWSILLNPGFLRFWLVQPWKHVATCASKQGRSFDPFFLGFELRLWWSALMQLNLSPQTCFQNLFLNNIYCITKFKSSADTSLENTPNRNGAVWSWRWSSTSIFDLNIQ